MKFIKIILLCVFLLSAYTIALAQDHSGDTSAIPNTLTRYEKQHGWKLLFDGKTSKGWRSPKQAGFPEKGWVIANGTMTVDPQKKDQPSGGDIITLDKYSAFDLKFEFKTTPVANSGVKYFVYIDSLNGPLGLEYQVLDDKLNPDAKLGRNGDRTEASLYDLIPAKKDSTLDKPIGQWNTGEIVVYPNNHVVHYLNGAKVWNMTVSRLNLNNSSRSANTAIIKISAFYLQDISFYRIMAAW